MHIEISKRLRSYNSQAVIQTVRFSLLLFVWEIARKIVLSFLAISCIKKVKIVPPKRQLAIYVTAALLRGLLSIFFQYFSNPNLRYLRQVLVCKRAFAITLNGWKTRSTSHVCYFKLCAGKEPQEPHKIYIYEPP